MNARVEKKEDDGYVDKLVAINRTAKVVKGGRRFGFTALVIVGDGNGRVGFGKGKAKEVMDAKKKASDNARKTLVKIPLREGRTIHHDINGNAGAGKVILRSAPSGTGIIAGGPMRAIFEALGIKDIVAKSTGTSNPFNMIGATFDALNKIESPRSTAQRRGLKISDIINNRESSKNSKKNTTSDKTDKEE